ncbi:ATP-binding protein, partial [Bacillus cereus group sp. TH230-1LC]|nr:ATP-binding protein [Bacillus cereus group sp. TH230-1LC]
MQKSVKTIVEQVAAMLRLVNEFRDYARLPPAVLQPVDVNLLVQDVLQLYTEEGVLVPVHMDLDTHCPRIAADPGQLRQVLHNLVQNAQDASLQRAQAEGVAVQPVCLSTQWNATTGRVRITVTDSGCGFPEALLQRAFEPYVTTKPKGTGLGLAVVKKIADEHGARVDLSNRLEGGVVKGAQVSLSFA